MKSFSTISILTIFFTFLTNQTASVEQEDTMYMAQQKIVIVAERMSGETKCAFGILCNQEF
jgi:hypothetical protein